VLVDGDQSYAAATVETIALAWGGLQPPKRAHYDFAVIGAGRRALPPPSTPPPTAARPRIQMASQGCMAGFPPVVGGRWLRGVSDQL
jgi:hypothetical protein